MPCVPSPVPQRQLLLALLVFSPGGHAGLRLQLTRSTTVPAPQCWTLSTRLPALTTRLLFPVSSVAIIALLVTFSCKQLTRFFSLVLLTLVILTLPFL